MFNPIIAASAAVVVLVAGGVYYYNNKSSKKETIEEVEEESVEEAVKRWEEELRAEGLDEETVIKIVCMRLETLRHREEEKTKREEEKTKREEEKAKREELKAKRDRDEFVSAVGGAAAFCLVAANIAIELPVVAVAASGAAVGYGIYNIFKD